MIGAVVVVYHPIFSEIERLLTRLYNQVEQVVIVDNSPAPNNFRSIIAHYDYLHFPENVGVAKAHNEGLKFLLKKGCEFGLLLDQDSLISDDFVFSMSSLLIAAKFEDKHIAAIGPTIECSFNHKLVKSHIQREIYEYRDLVGVTQIIASGMLLDMGVLDLVGLKDESLFIDGVDHEWCWRAKTYQYTVARARNVIMQHRLGDSRSKFIGITYKVGAPIRLYYQFRNILLLSRRGYVPRYWKLRCLSLLPVRFFLNSLFQKNKAKRVNYMLRGLLDGVLGRTGSYEQHWHSRTQPTSLIKKSSE